MKRIGLLALPIAAAFMLSACAGGAAVAELTTKLSEAEQARSDADNKVAELEEQVATLTQERDDALEDLEKHSKKKRKKKKIAKATPKPTPKPTAKVTPSLKIRKTKGKFGGKK